MARLRDGPPSLIGVSNAPLRAPSAKAPSPRALAIRVPAAAASCGLGSADRTSLINFFRLATAPVPQASNGAWTSDTAKGRSNERLA